MVAEVEDLVEDAMEISVVEVVTGTMATAVRRIIIALPNQSQNLKITCAMWDLHNKQVTTSPMPIS